MRKVWGTGTLWILIAIFLLFCVTPTAFTQQNSTGSKELQYTVTVDLQELVDTVKELTRNVSALTENQKELSDNIKELTNSVSKINEKMSAIEERTKWMKDLLFVLLGGVLFTIAIPIILYFLPERGKKNTSVSKISALDEVKKENQDEAPYDTSTEDELQAERGIP